MRSPKASVGTTCADDLCAGMFFWGCGSGGGAPAPGPKFREKSLLNRTEAGEGRGVREHHHVRGHTGLDDAGGGVRSCADTAADTDMPIWDDTSKNGGDCTKDAMKGQTSASGMRSDRRGWSEEESSLCAAAQQFKAAGPVISYVCPARA